MSRRGGGPGRCRARLLLPAVLVGALTTTTGGAAAYALWSTTATTTVQAQAATVGTPRDFSCTSLLLAARLSWSPPVSGPAPTSYVLERSGTATGSYTAVQWLTGGTLSTTIDALLGGGHYRVRASLAPAPTNPPWQPPAAPAWVSAPTASKQVGLLSLGCV